MSNTDNKMSVYDLKVHRLGRTSTIIMIIVLACVPIALSLIFNVKVDMGKIATIILGVLALFGIAGAIEFLSYSPILGAGGTYLAFITGNIINMKVPAAMSSVKITGFEPGSKEAEVVSMIAVAVSSIVTMIILFLGMLFISSILPVLQSPALSPAFENVMPALLGALAVPVFKKDFKTAIVPCAFAAVLTLVMGYAGVAKIEAFLIPVYLVISVGWKYVLYKRSKKKEEAKKEEENQ